MLFNSYSYEILCEQFYLIYLQENVQLLLVTVDNRLKFEIEIVHDLSCHPINLVLILNLVKKSAYARQLPHILKLCVSFRPEWRLRLFHTADMRACVTTKSDSQGTLPAYHEDSHLIPHTSVRHFLHHRCHHSLLLLSSRFKTHLFSRFFSCIVLLPFHPRDWLHGLQLIFRFSRACLF